jgi:hypothetical protein
VIPRKFSISTWQILIGATLACEETQFFINDITVKEGSFAGVTNGNLSAVTLPPSHQPNTLYGVRVFLSASMATLVW